MEEEKPITRCFVCIDVSREVVNEITRIEEEIGKKKLFIGKFVEPENLHLTLKFLGEISDEKIEEVKTKLKEIKFSGFKAYLGELGVFSSNFIRIIWAHVLGKKIEELQLIVDEKLKDIFPKESRFMSHLTIARVKTVKDKNLLLEALKSVRIQNIGFDVKEFYLMKSELKDYGPEYSVLEKFELK